MRKFKIYLITFLIFSSSLFSQTFEDVDVNTEKSFKTIQRVFQNELIGNANLDTLKGWKQFKRWEWFWEQRLGENEQIPNPIKRYEILNAYSEVNKKINITQSIKYESLGPFDIPQKNTNTQGIGRVNCLAFHPTNSSIMYAGAASGGIWKSTNTGQNWFELKAPGLNTVAVSDIAISTSNPNIIYVATGDANGTLGTGSDFYSVGIIKSTDGGNSWNLTNIYKSLSDRYTVSRILVHPQSSNIVIAGTSSGIYKSTDGGNTWTNELSNNLVKDLEIKPFANNTVYASTLNRQTPTRIFKSTDFGSTWELKRQIDGATRTELAISRNNPDYIYSVSAASHRGLLEFSFSSNSGETWNIAATQTTVGNLLGWNDGSDLNRGQGIYDLAIEANPNDFREVYIGGVNAWRTRNLGISFQMIGHWTGGFGAPQLKADQHYFTYDKSGNNFYTCADGGIYRTNNFTSWEKLSNGLNITQNYKIAVSQAETNTFMGGTQDNGTMLLRNNNWIKVIGGDGMNCEINPNNPNILYGSLYYGQLRRSTNGGANFTTSFSPSIISSQYGETENGAWVTPFVIDPNNSSIIYAGYNNVWKNTNNGNRNNWVKISDFGFPITNTFNTIAVAKGNSNIIYAGTRLNLFKTNNGGQTWENLINSGNTITSISISETNSHQFYITKSGYTPNDKVYYYNGEQLINITGNLPNVPVNTAYYSNDEKNTIYIGTDIGVFYSDYNSGYWIKLQGDVPNFIVTDLVYHTNNKRLYIGTYGRGLWSMNLLDCNNQEIVLNESGTIRLCEGDSLILEATANYSEYKWSNGETSRQLIVKETGTYSLAGFESGSYCASKSNSVDVIFESLPNVNINSEPEVTLCEGDTLKLIAPFGVQNYSWSTGETQRILEVTKSGQYYLTAENNLGCTAKSNIINITFIDRPQKPKIIQDKDFLFVETEFAVQWYLNGNLLEGQDKNILKISEIGDYKVIIYNGNCSIESDELKVISSVESIKDMNVSIFPNPSSGYFSIQNNSDQIINKVELISSNGLKVYEYLNSTNVNYIDLNVNLAKGIYIMKLYFDNNIKFSKIIIQ